MIKRKFFQRLQYSWIAYLLILIVPIFIWNLTFTIILRPKHNEKIEITIFNNDDFNVLDFNNFFSDLINEENDKSLSVVTNQNLKQVTMESIYPDQRMFYTLLQAKKSVSDLLIFHEDQLKSETTDDETRNWIYPSLQFNPIQKDKLKTIFENRGHTNFDSIEFYEIDGVAYGIYLNNDISGKSITTGNNYEFYDSSTCRSVVFLSSESENMASLYGIGNAEDGAAIDIIAFLLEDYNE